MKLYKLTALAALALVVPLLSAQPVDAASHASTHRAPSRAWGWYDEFGTWHPDVNAGKHDTEGNWQKVGH